MQKLAPASAVRMAWLEIVKTAHDEECRARMERSEWKDLSEKTNKYNIHNLKGRH